MKQDGNLNNDYYLIYNIIFNNIIFNIFIIVYLFNIIIVERFEVVEEQGKCSDRGAVLIFVPGILEIENVILKLRCGVYFIRFVCYLFYFYCIILFHFENVILKLRCSIIRELFISKLSVFLILRLKCIV